MATPHRGIQQDKQRVYVTPRIEDVLVVEPRSVSVEKDVAYGEAHPEGNKYPNHFLVYIEEQKQPDGTNRALWYYAAPRERQDLYNYEITYPYAGLLSCPRIQRTYVELRATYTPKALGSLDPLAASVAPEHAKFAGAKLILERQERISKEFDSYFVTVTRVYERVPTTEEQSAYNASISYPFAGIKTAPRYTRTYVIPVADYAPLTIGDADPQYQTAKLTEQRVEKGDTDSEGRYVVVTRVYERIPSAEEQDTSNYAITYPFAGLTSCPRYTRTYVLPKATAALALGTADPKFPTALLVQQKAQPAEARESSYDIVTRVYERIPSESEQSAYNAEISYPYQGRTTNPRYTRRYVLPIAGYAPLANGDADPQNVTAKLADQQTGRFGDALADSRYLLAIRVYDVFPSDPLVTQELELPIGIPEKFLTSTSRRTEVLVLPEGASATLNLAGGDITAGLVGVSQKLLVEDGARKAKHTVYLQVGTGPLVGSEIDRATGKRITYTQTIVPAGTLGTNIDANGNISEVAPIDQYYSVKTTRKVSSLAIPGEEHDWNTHVHYVWPPVMRSWRVWFVSGRFKYDIQYEPGYAGPCLARITDTWSATPPEVTEPVTMRPESYEITLITTDFQIRESLHPEIIVEESQADGGASSGMAPATNYLEWPEYIDLIDVDPFPDGGYMKRVTRIFAPTN